MGKPRKSSAHEERQKLFVCDIKFNTWLLYAITETVYYGTASVILMVSVVQEKDFLFDYSFMPLNYFYLKLIISIIMTVSSCGFIIAVLKDIGAFCAPIAIGNTVHTVLIIIICSSIKWSVMYRKYYAELNVVILVIVYTVAENVITIFLILYWKKRNYEKKLQQAAEEPKHPVIRWKEETRNSIKKYYAVPIKSVYKLGHLEQQETPIKGSKKDVNETKSEDATKKTVTEITADVQIQKDGEVFDKIESELLGTKEDGLPKDQDDNKKYE